MINVYDTIQALSASPIDVRKQFFQELVKVFGTDTDLQETIIYDDIYHDILSNEDGGYLASKHHKVTAIIDDISKEEIDTLKEEIEELNQSINFYSKKSENLNELLALVPRDILLKIEKELNND